MATDIDMQHDRGTDDVDNEMTDSEEENWPLIDVIDVHSQPINGENDISDADPIGLDVVMQHSSGTDDADNEHEMTDSEEKTEGLIDVPPLLIDAFEPSEHDGDHNYAKKSTQPQPPKRKHDAGTSKSDVTEPAGKKKPKLSALTIDANHNYNGNIPLIAATDFSDEHEHEHAADHDVIDESINDENDIVPLEMNAVMQHGGGNDNTTPANM